MCIQHLIFVIVGSGEGEGGLTVVEQGGRGCCPWEGPVQMHQQQPQAAAINTSSCCFVLVGSGMEPWLIAFLCVPFMCNIFRDGSQSCLRQFFKIEKRLRCDLCYIALISHSRSQLRCYLKRCLIDIAHIWLVLKVFTVIATCDIGAYLKLKFTKIHKM